MSVQRKRMAAGFTLVEVLAAMVLLSIVLPIAMRGVSVALLAAENAKHSAEAAALGESKLNELVVAGNVTNGSGDFGTDWPSYSWQMTTTSREFNVSEAALTVKWQQRGQDRTLVISTLVADPTQGAAP